jgi:uncharacterized membrane protein
MQRCGGEAAISDALRTRLWPLPTLAIGVAVALGCGCHCWTPQHSYTTRWRSFDAGVAGAISIDFERASAQDIGYELRQLTDVAVKALSPASTIRRPRCTAIDTARRCYASWLGGSWAHG